MATLKPWSAFITVEALPDESAVEWRAAQLHALIPADSEETAERVLESAVQQLGFRLVRVDLPVTSHRPMREFLRDAGLSNDEIPDDMPDWEQAKETYANRAVKTGQVQFFGLRPFLFHDAPPQIEKIPGLESLESSAADEAERLGSACVGPEHLLLGYIKFYEDFIICSDLSVLNQLGVDCPALKKRLEGIVAAAEHPETLPDDLPLSPDAERVMRVAFDIAAEMLCGFCQPNHLLLALIREEELLPGGLFRELNVSYEAAREVVRKLLDCRSARELLDPKSDWYPMFKLTSSPSDS